MRTRATCVLLIVVDAFAFTTTPAAKEVVMYHVNPQRFGPVPLNMDTADEAGDLFFELMEVLTVPLACSDPKRDQRSHFECDNPEADDPTDVVNKITLTVTQGFSEYAMCNIGRNGTDGLGHDCKDDTYCCFCFDESGSHHHWPPPTVPCNATVGMTNVYSRHRGGHWFPCLKDYECFSSRASDKFTPQTPGFWYSPLEYGACSLHSSPEQNCTWSVKSVDKIVSKKCHGNSFFGAVQAAAPSCFSTCPSSKVNASDPCWVRCFYKAVLGPTAGEPRGKVEGGLPLEEVLRYWRRPFESDDPDHGGCPSLPGPPMDQILDGITAHAETTPELKHMKLSRRQQRWRAFAQETLPVPVPIQ